MSNLVLSLGIESLEILSQTVDIKGNIIVEVKSLKTETPCHKCGKSIKKFHTFGETITVCQWQSKSAPDGGEKVHHFC